MLLKAYNWPGNIRELENCMERIVLLAPSLHVNAHVLTSVLPAKRDVDVKVFETKADLEALERQTIIKVLKECGGIKIHAAKKLGISNRQIGYKIQKFDITAEEYF